MLDGISTAVRRNSLEKAKLLVVGADVTRKGYKGRTPLGLAEELGEQHVQVVSFLRGRQAIGNHAPDNLTMETTRRQTPHVQYTRLIVNRDVGIYMTNRIATRYQPDTIDSTLPSGISMSKFGSPRVLKPLEVDSDDPGGSKTSKEITKIHRVPSERGNQNWTDS